MNAGDVRLFYSRATTVFFSQDSKKCNYTFVAVAVEPEHHLSVIVEVQSSGTTNSSLVMQSNLRYVCSGRFGNYCGRSLLIKSINMELPSETFC
jgi:hypothetical protein